MLAAAVSRPSRSGRSSRPCVPAIPRPSQHDRVAEAKHVVAGEVWIQPTSIRKDVTVEQPPVWIHYRDRYGSRRDDLESSSLRLCEEAPHGQRRILKSVPPECERILRLVRPPATHVFLELVGCETEVTPREIQR